MFNIHIVGTPNNYAQDDQFSSAKCFANIEQNSVFQRANKVRARLWLEDKEDRGVTGDNQHDFNEGKLCPASVVTFCDGWRAWLISEEQQMTSTWTSAKHLTPSDILVSKLDSGVFDKWITCWIRNWLSGWTQRVVVKSSTSKRRSVTIYIPQGSVLGPALLNIFVNGSMILEQSH